MIFGIDTRIYNNHNVYKALEELVKREFNIVELCSKHLEEVEREDIEYFKRYVKIINVKIIQSHSSHDSIDKELASLDVNVREKAFRKFLKQLDLCYAVECPIIVTTYLGCRKILVLCFNFLKDWKDLNF